MPGITDPWRDIGHVKWYDSLAALEDTNGPEFKQAVSDEMTKWNMAKKRNIAAWTRDYEYLLKAALPCSPDYAEESFLWQSYIVKLQAGYGHRQHVWFTKQGKTVRTFTNLSGFGVDPDSDHFFTLRDVGDGAEILQLDIYTIGQQATKWSKSPVGPNAAFSNNNIVYQTVENYLRYPAIIVAEKETGNHPKTIFQEDDKRFQVELIQPYNQKHIFIKTANALTQRLGYITPAHSVKWITPVPEKNADGQGTTLCPIDIHIWGTNKALIIDDKSYPYPDATYLTDAMYSKHNTHIYVVTTKDASARLYEFDMAKHKYTLLYSHKGPNHIMLLEDNSIKCVTPYTPAIVCSIRNHTLDVRLIYPEPLDIKYHHYGKANSQDGTKVPYTLVSTTKNPKALIVEGYGSYGISSNRGYPMRWLPWLKRGYAYAVASPRGGRENGDNWYDDARTALRKQNTFDDVAAVIKTVQNKLAIKPHKTVFYGRSAGGLLAANIAQQFPHLIGGVYAEVPYVDVLRTTTNPTLPLTQLEYDEFGNPAKRPEEYDALQRISPVDTVPYAPEHSPFIVVKTGVNDVQVLPYETIKWAKKLRANNWTVYVGVDTDGGHFAAEADMYSQEAEDAALIDTQLHHSRAAARARKTRRHVSRGTTSRRTSSRKHVTRHSTSASAE